MGGEPKVVFLFRIESGRIAGIDMVADPNRLRELELTFLD
jgi:hypothetical protein